MKSLVVVVVVSSILGCLDASEEPLTSREQEIGVKPGHCPDPTDCSVANGGGLYAEQGGHIGAPVIGADVMVARFINVIDSNGVPSVVWEGRSNLGSSTGNYGDSGSGVAYAQFGTATPTYHVLSIAENFTQPVITLSASDDGSNPFTVTGAQLLDLRLIVSAPWHLLTFPVTLYFASEGPTAAVYKDPLHPQHRYSMFIDEGGPTPVPFCKLASAQPDYVVFQQGISVDTLTGKTTFDREDTVTISCSTGAIAKVHAWGYQYRNIPTNYQTLFEAAIHMKRASYCGDITTYTVAGTNISIDDVAGIRQSSFVTNATVEARWGRASDGKVRALCVNTTKLRRPGLKYPPTSTGLPFLGDCYPDDGSAPFSLKECGTLTPSGTVVSDALSLKLL